MTKLRVPLLALLLMVCLLALAPLRAESAATTANFNGLEGFVEQVMKDWHVPGLAVAIVKNGEVVYAKGFGYRDVKKGLKVTPDTLFAIGSCSKKSTRRRSYRAVT